MRGRSSLAVAALLAMATGVIGSDFPITRRRGDDDTIWSPTQEPDDRGRRAEKNAIALAKAEAKRQRKAAKRAAQKAESETTDKRPNVK